MLSLFKSSRCGRCYTERFVRVCSRKGKNTCWKCCNELRCDGNCPISCAYAPRNVEGSEFPSYKADSLNEGRMVLKLHIDLWIGRQNAQLENKTPSAFAQSKPQEMLAWLSGFQYPKGFPVDYLMEKLGLHHQETEPVDDPESCAEAYLNTLIQLQWNKLHDYSINQSTMPDLADRYTELLQAIPTLSKINTYSIIHSGLGEDGISAIVFVELNHKQDWTLLLSNRNGKWQIRQNIAGNPQLYFAQNQVYSEIAQALGKADDAVAWEKLESALKSYPDSADLYYYKAIYWQLVKQLDKATVDFFNAIALDNDWPEPYFHLGAIYLSKKDFAQAAMWFAELTRLQPDNPNAFNNLAAAYAGGGETEKASEIWKMLLIKFPGFELAQMNLDKLN